jgi:hypothetical protein
MCRESIHFDAELQIPERWPSQGRRPQCAMPIVCHEVNPDCLSNDQSWRPGTELNTGRFWYLKIDEWYPKSFCIFRSFQGGLNPDTLERAGQRYYRQD